MNKNPDFRVLVGSGIYDMKTTTSAAMYLLAQSGWPRIVSYKILHSRTHGWG